MVWVVNDAQFLYTYYNLSFQLTNQTTGILINICCNSSINICFQLTDLVMCLYLTEMKLNLKKYRHLMIFFQSFKAFRTNTLIIT